MLSQRGSSHRSDSKSSCLYTAYVDKPKRVKRVTQNVSERRRKNVLGGHEGQAVVLETFSCRWTLRKHRQPQESGDRE